MGPIRYEDDLMVVRDPDGKVTYKGIVDEYVEGQWSSFERYWHYDDKQELYIHEDEDGISTLEILDI